MYKAKIVNSGELSRRVSKMIEPGATRSGETWAKILGEENFDIAIQSGVLVETIKPKNVYDKVDFGLDDGEFIVYSGDRGYVLYFGSDGATWRAEAPSMDQFKPELAKKVDGINPLDVRLKVVKQGSQGTSNEIEGEYQPFSSDMADIRGEALGGFETPGMGGRYNDANIQ